MRSYWIAALAGVVLIGCTSAVILRHPQTGQTVKCGPYHLGYVAREAQCISDYQRQGYERVPD